MAGRSRVWILLLVLAALLIGAGVGVWAQAADSGSLLGKLTDLHSTPLAGVSLVLRNQATGAQARATTRKNGSYSFIGLDPGEYTLDAESPQVGRGHVDGILISAGSEARVQTAIQLELFPVEPLHTISDSIALGPAAGSVPVPDMALKAPPLAARMPAELSLEKPKTAIPQGTFQLAAEPLRQLAVRGRSPEDWLRAPPQTVLVPLNAPLSLDPLHTLSLIGRSLPPPVPPIVPPPSIPPPAPGQQPTAREAGRNAQLLLASTGAPAQGSAGLNVLTQPWGGAEGFALGVAALSVLRAAMDSTQSSSRFARMGSQDAEPASPVATTTISGEQLQALPASGRSWQDFVLETPAAAAPAGDDNLPVARGTGQEQPAVAVDGVSRGLAFGSSEGWTRGRGPAISEGAIREVQRAVGNVEASSSRAAGGRIGVETLRGSNSLHGQGFLFDRQNTWGAQNPFTQWVKETAPATQTTAPVFTPQAYTPSDHEATWGIGLGSRIRRDKLFWFAALDNSKRNDPGLATVKHPDMFFAQPSNDQLQVLSARLGLSSANPVAAGLAAYSSALETLAGLLGPAARTATQWTGFARIDWEVAERHRFTLEGTGARWDSPGGGLTRVEETYGSHSFGSSQASEQWLLARWEAFLTPNLLAVTQGSAGRTILNARPDTPSSYEQTLLQRAWGQLPQIAVDPRYGFTLGNPSRFGAGSYPDEHLYRAQETVDWVRGGLLLKAGFDFTHSKDATSLLRNQTGTYSYASVENFVSDALVYGAFGLSGELNPMNQRNCDQTGKVWRDSAGNLRGLGDLPCYSYYSQVMGPNDWWLATNEWAGFATAQWQPKRTLVLSAGLRWEREQMPPPIAALNNPELPLTEKLPSLGNQWGPRLSLAWGAGESRWPVLRLGYGLFFGQVENSTLETALTQTGSPSGDLNFFLRPTDNLNSGGAPPFPYVLAGEPFNVVKPQAVEFAPGFHSPEVHQAVVGLEENLPGHLQVTASGMVSLGRQLPVFVDANFDPAVTGTIGNLQHPAITYAVVDATGAGPIKAARITVPSFYTSWPSSLCPSSAQRNIAGQCGWLNPDYQQIEEIVSKANSTYEAAILKVVRYGRRGLNLRAHYAYSHATDWNPNESPLNPVDPANFSQTGFSMEYGTSSLDVRHSAAATVIWETPWKLRDGPHRWAGIIGNGWMLSAIGQFRSGLPYTMRTAGSLAEEFLASSGAAVVALGPGMNGSGGDSRVYGVGSDGKSYNIGRNTYRYPPAWKADMRLGKRFELGHMRQLELLAESFNLFNHQNVTELETVGYSIEPGNLSGGLPTLNFLTGLKANTTAFGQPLNVNATDFYRERQFQVGLRIRF